MSYIQTNLNPAGIKIGDCVVRAIAKATGKSWTTVYNELCQAGLSQYRLPNDKQVYSTYLLQNNFTKHKMPKDNNRRITLKQFSETNNKGVFIVNVVKHLTVVINGDVYDNWDCSNKCVGNYWSKKNN